MPASLRLFDRSSQSTNSSPTKHPRKPSRRLSSYSTYSRSPNSLLAAAPNTATTSISRVFASPEFELNEDNNARPTLRSAHSSASLRRMAELSAPVTESQPKVVDAMDGGGQSSVARGQDIDDANTSGAGESPQVASESPPVAEKLNAVVSPTPEICAQDSTGPFGDSDPQSPPTPATTPVAATIQPGDSNVPYISQPELVSGPIVDPAVPSTASDAIVSHTPSSRVESTPRKPEPSKPSGSWFSSLLGRPESSAAEPRLQDAPQPQPVQQESEPQPAIPVTTSPETTTIPVEETVHLPPQEAEAALAPDVQEIPEYQPTAPPPTPVPSPASASPPSTNPIQEAATQQKSSGSWFSSFGRSKGKQTSEPSTAPSTTGQTTQEAQQVPASKTEGDVKAEVRTEQLGPAAESTEPVQAPTSPSPTIQPVPTQRISSAYPIPKTKSQSHNAKRSWFSSSPKQPSPLSSPDAAHTAPSPAQTDSKDPLTHPNSSHTSLSIDDEVPVASPTAIVFPTMQGEVVAVDGEDKEEPASQAPEGDGASVNNGTVRRRRLSSLNPSTSRFTLTIPLLGRAKVPLSEAVAKSQPESEGGPSQSTDKHVLSPVITSEPSPISRESSGEPVMVTPATPESESSHDENSSAAAAAQTSWWGYYWSSTTTTTTTVTVKQDSQSLAPVDNTVNSESKSDSGVTVKVTPPSPPLHQYAASDSAIPSAKPVERQKSEDVMSMTSTQTHTMSAWYAPWTWYGPTPAESSTEPKQEASEGVNGHGKTESEIIKEAALAREDPPVQPKEEAKSAITTQAENNPVAQSINANSSSWASFFSSNANLLMLRSGGKMVSPGLITATNSSEMEVMNLDEEEGAPPTPEPSKRPESISSSRERKPAPPMTISDSVREQAQRIRKGSTGSTASAASRANDKGKKDEDKTPRRVVPSKDIKSPPSPTPSKASVSSKEPPPPPKPNLVLPTWEDTFHTRPRNSIPQDMLPRAKDTFSEGRLAKTMKFVSGVLFDTPETSASKKEQETGFEGFGKELPRAFDVLRQAGIMGQNKNKGKEREKPDTEGIEDVLRGCRRVVVIGIHGWFPGAVMRSVLGEPTGTSDKFASMMIKALEQFQDEHGVKLEKITPIKLEGEGTINRRVDRLYSALLANSSWMTDIHECDAILVATHSQGSIVSTHIIDKLIRDGHIVTSAPHPVDYVGAGLMSPPSGGDILVRKPQRVCCLALCGIHLGPLRYLSGNSLLQPYFQYFESTAARELFEFQNTENEVSKAYVEALRNVTNHGTKMVYVASLNDQVVPIYSGIFAAASHPLILRALYIDGDAYSSSDFLSNLLVLLLRIMNTGLSDSGLLTHLSEATAGSLNGVGHSTAYEELAVYSLAVNYLFLTNDGLENGHPELKVEPFNAAHEQNDYEIPWSLRDLIASPAITHFFLQEIMQLRDAFSHWHPKTSILRDVKRKLQPITKLPKTETGNLVGPSRL